MSLKKDYSIVADSEMASSPRSFTSPAPIKRATRTYGRRREDPDTSFTYSEQDSRDSIYKTGPPDMLDEVPPSPSEPSKLLDNNDEDEDEDGDEDMLPNSLQGHSFSFGWRDRMKELDEVDDFSEHLKPPAAHEDAPSKEVALNTPASMDINGDSPAKGSGARTSTSAASEDVFSSSLSSLASPSQLTTTQGGSIPKPASIASRNRPRIQKNIITSDDDMDHYDNCDNRPSSPQTSSPHLIATPKSQFPSSPPTSHHDDLSVNSAPSSSKGKISRSRHSVAPIRFPSPRPEGFDNLENATRPRSTLGQRGKKQKVKPPTKKERQETLREQARIIAGQPVSIEKPAGQERSLATLFGKLIQQKAIPLAAAEPVESPAVQHPSSPIGDFTSSQPQPHEDVASQPSATLGPGVSNSRLSPSPLWTKGKDSQLARGDDSDSDGLPDVDAVLNSTKSKEKSEEEDVQAKRQKLNALKLQMLKRQEQQSNTKSEEDDDELQVLSPTKIEQQRKSTDKKISAGQRMLLVNARVRNKPLILDARKSTKEDIINVEELLKQGTSDPRVLKSLLRQRAEKESLDIVKQKEEEWKRLGGAMREERENEQVDDAQRDQIQKGLEAWTNADRKFEDEDEDGSEDDEDDEDWSPEARGSMSPPPGREEEGDIAHEETEMDEVDEAGTPKGDQEGEGEEQRFQSDDDENEQLPVFKVKTKHRPRGRVVDSDESDSGEYNDENVIPPKPKDPHYAASSSDDRTEDENDKENDTRLMFDRSEDKENKAVVRHQPIARPSLSFGSIFDGESDGDLSLSPPHVMARELEMGEEIGTQSSTSSSERRKPLGVISDASPASSLQRQPSTLTQAFAAQLKHSSPVRGPVDEDVFGPVLTSPVAFLDFAPVFGGGDGGKEKKSAPGFSQFSQDVSGHSSFGAPALLQAGFSDLFDSSTQKDAAPLGGLRRQESLGLTQDLELQPAFQVDEKLLRKADAIFEKEQEYVVEAAVKKSVKEQELYVNDVGLLTQTRPSASRLGTRSPSFVLSPTQTKTQSSLSGLGFTQTQTQQRTSNTSISSQTQPRPPLRTISLSNPLLSSPEASPKRRLRKRGETPTPRSSPVRSPVTSNTFVNTSPPPLRQINAFDVLGKAPPKAKDKGKGKDSALEKLARREWLADEAEESDEDHMVGFGFVKKKDGEDDDEAVGVDLDATLPELVDDQKMDEETEGVDKVLEKHQELLEKDDEAALKFHQGVAQGELRKKRKNRLGLDDSDDEDEEDDRARRIRRKMREKTERGDIQELAANEKTAAFANVYQTGLIDDDPIETRPLDLELDFRTDREIGDEDVVMGDSQDDENQGDGTEAEEEEDDNNRYITHKDIQAQIRKLKERPEEEVETLDYEDVSWIDRQVGDDEIESMQVKMITATGKRSTVNASTAKPVTEWDAFMLGGVKRKENEKDLARSRAWAKNETRNMTGSTGRLVGGIAVTGHGNKTKNGGGSLRSKASLSSASAASVSGAGKKPLKPEGSILAGIAKRKEQFQ
ncbi:hypothetical protein P691DRAFT_772498 [Macrolepiota fuliginosa MF-IS2]|uniref:DNA replication checkpoint mediator MRC1 domain-containing protein n=1 Tax=Macrolepiota fuliginosa MF-IS2 TaxID=1400762 RepID=A0A9P5XJR9_9AGAR|nr:hypothetical protein P691DRAFT_772498 [Macrolepiota fuliginosa MF-IS2]